MTREEEYLISRGLEVVDGEWRDPSSGWPDMMGLEDAVRVQKEKDHFKWAGVED